MARYEVVKPWAFSVKAGDVIETDNLHPSLVHHVRPLPDVVARKDEAPKVMEVATPQRGRPKKDKGPE